MEEINNIEEINNLKKELNNLREINNIKENNLKDREIENDEELEPLTKPKSKKIRTQKQIDSFNIALQKRAEKIEQRKKKS